MDDSLARSRRRHYYFEDNSFREIGRLGSKAPFLKAPIQIQMDDWEAFLGLAEDQDPLLVRQVVDSGYRAICSYTPTSATRLPVLYWLANNCRSIDDTLEAWMCFEYPDYLEPRKLERFDRNEFFREKFKIECILFNPAGGRLAPETLAKLADLHEDGTLHGRAKAAWKRLGLKVGPSRHDIRFLLLAPPPKGSALTKELVAVRRYVRDRGLFNPEEEELLSLGWNVLCDRVRAEHGWKKPRALQAPAEEPTMILEPTPIIPGDALHDLPKKSFKGYDPTFQSRTDRNAWKRRGAPKQWARHPRRLSLPKADQPTL